MDKNFIPIGTSYYRPHEANPDFQYSMESLGTGPSYATHKDEL